MFQNNKTAADVLKKDDRIVITGAGGFIGGSLARYSREAAPGGVRGQQLRTMASVINGVGMFVILFVTALQVLKVLNIDIAPLLASAGIVGLLAGEPPLLLAELHRRRMAG